MIAAVPPAHDAERDRFGRFLERQDDADFPYYTGIPVALSGGQWLTLVAAVVVGFLVLTNAATVIPAIEGTPVPAILFTGIQLGALAFVALGHWTAIFRRVGLSDIGWMVFYAVLNIFILVVVAFIVSRFAPVSANPQQGGFSGGTAEVLNFAISTAIQLLGEELLVILPFLALMWVLVSRMGWSRKRAILLSWLLTAIWFGAAHLPTYDWNVAQALLVIGASRIAFTAACIRTKNIWVSTGAHILNDWTLFATTAVAGGGAS